LNSSGQLGYGHVDSLGDEPGEMGDNLPRLDLGGGDATKIDVRGHSCAEVGGGVKCWGYNYFGHVGNGSTDSVGDEPGEMGDNLPFVELFEILVSSRSLSVGYNHTCVVLAVSPTSIKCWGHNGFGQLGVGHYNTLGDEPGEMGDNLPWFLDASTAIDNVNAGEYHTCARFVDGSAMCWGEGGYGQLGIGGTSGVGGSGPPTEYVSLGTGKTVADTITSRNESGIQAGHRHTCALLNDATVKCWGNNFFGQLGQGHTNQLGDQPGEMGDNLPIVDLGS
jgi:hypothetical protein